MAGDLRRTNLYRTVITMTSELHPLLSKSIRKFETILFLHESVNKQLQGKRSWEILKPAFSIITLSLRRPCAAGGISNEVEESEVEPQARSSNSFICILKMKLDIQFNASSDKSTLRNVWKFVELKGEILINDVSKLRQERLV